MRAGAFLRLSRPFTLLAPAVGMVSGGIAALGYGGHFSLPDWGVRHIALGALAAALLNVASNAVNQIFDLEIDRINKPDRPLPSGAATVRQAGALAAAAYAGSLATAWAVNETLFWIVALTVLLTYAYSGPPFRTKRHWAFSNLTIATPRGFLLPLAGWTAVSGSAAYGGEVLPTDAWALAAVSGVFILGAATTKDYADMEGDRAGGCTTIPLRFGVEKSVRAVALFLVAPWIALAVLTWTGTLTGNPTLLFWGGLVTAAVGGRAGWLLVTKPEALTDGSTHPAWVLMYLMMVGSQILVAVAYAVDPALLSGLAP